MQHISETRISAPQTAHSSIGSRLLHWLLDMDRGHRERRVLERLSDHQLDDIGLSRSELEAGMTARRDR